MEDLAGDIVRRANNQNISINKLCKAAGISRRWFEYFKQRTPKAVAAYVKINEYLTRIENNNHGNNNYPGTPAED